MIPANKKPEEKNTALQKFVAFIPVWVQIIICIGGVAVASVPFFAGWLVPLLPTKSTPAPTEIVILNPSDVPPTLTNVPSVPPTTAPALGEDWPLGCISEQWQIYPFEQIDKQGGCYDEPIWEFISTQSGGLYILAQHKNLISADEYGLFGLLPQSADVSFTVNFDLIENAEVWFGVFSEPNIDSDGVLIVVPPGDMNEHAFAVRIMPNQKRVDLTQIYLSPQGIYNLGFNLERGTVNAVIENVEREKFAFSAPQRWLFIGYRAKLEVANGKARVTALISNLVITPK